MNNQFLEIRNPFLKSIKFENIDKSSTLYTLYTQNNISKTDLIDSEEDPFLIAFLYNEIYDITEYLYHLKSKPITNCTYNILKHYLKFQDKKFIDDFFLNNNLYSTKNQENILYILKGEIYRINKYEIDNYNEYFFFGYVSIGNILLGNFNKAFKLFSMHNTSIITLLNISHKNVKSAVLENIQYYIDYLIKSENILSFLDNLDFNELDSCHILEIFKMRNFSKSRIDQICSKLKDESKIYKIFTNGNYEIYQHLMPIIIRRIKNLEVDIEYLKKYISIIFYKNNNSFDKIFDQQILKKSLKKLREDNEFYSLIFIKPGIHLEKIGLIKAINNLRYKIMKNNELKDLNDKLKDLNNELKVANNELKDLNDKLEDSNNKFKVLNNKPQNSNNELEDSNNELKDLNNRLENLNNKIEDLNDKFKDKSDDKIDYYFEEALLFMKCNYFLNFNELSLDDILEMPENFFNLALKYSKNPVEQKIKNFNDNFMNERLKIKISNEIDPDIFKIYLIKRHKLFNISFDGYEHIMDDKYKLMYAQFNLEWASRNIEVLSKIGINEKLFRSLKNSKFSDCLKRIEHGFMEIYKDKIKIKELIEDNKRKCLRLD